MTRYSKHEQQERKAKAARFADFVSSATMIALLLSTEGELAAENPEAVAVMMVEARNYGLQECTLPDLFEMIFRDGGRVAIGDPLVSGALEEFRRQRNRHRANPTHSAKRYWAAKVGLFVPYDERPTFAQWLALNNIKVIIRPPFTDGILAKRTVLYEYEPTPAPLDVSYAVVDEAHGYYVVPEEESVCFVMEVLRGGVTVLKPLLTILRNVGGVNNSDNIAALQFFTYMDAVIETACNGERRGVRPNEPGMMAQLGYNAGPRHARVWGLAKSYVRDLPMDTKMQHDRDCIALMSMSWGMIRTHMHSEDVDAFEKVLDDVNMPRMATRSVEEGDGYEFVLDGQRFSFPLAPRAPPEGYLVQAYSARSHTDPIEDGVPKAWSLHSGVYDLVTDLPDDSMDATTATEPSYRIMTRSQTRRLREQGVSHASPVIQQPSAARPASYGGSFVDCELRVVVRPARATIIEFDPRRLHGSTRQHNRITRACAFTASTYIHDAFRRAQEGPCVQMGLSGTGADTE